MKRMAWNGINLALAVALLGLTASAQTQPVSNSQNSTPTSSLGDYARQLRKDTGHSKTRSFDNDNLPKDDKLSIVGSAESTGSSEASATAATEDSSASKPQETTAAPASEAQTETKPAKSENHSSPEGKPKNTPATGTSAAAEAKPESKPEVKATEEKPASPATSPDEEAAARQAQWKQWGEKIDTQKEQIDLAERELNVLQREYQIRAAAMYGDAGNRLRNQADWDKQDAQYKQQIADKQKAVEDAKQRLDDMQEDARRAGVPASVREPE